MFLSKLNYTQFPGEPREWMFNNLILHNLNLIVGKNAIGKSRVLNVIIALAALVSGESKLKYLSGEYVAIFKEKESEYKYEISYKDKKIFKESLKVDGVTKLERGVGALAKYTQ